MSVPLNFVVNTVLICTILYLLQKFNGTDFKTKKNQMKKLLMIF